MAALLGHMQSPPMSVRYHSPLLSIAGPSLRVSQIAASKRAGKTTMQRAMAKQAEAEREKRAKVIHAEGELLASTQLAQAAAVIGSQPAALQLRYLQTLTEIAVEKNSTIVFPLPLDLVAPLIQIMQRQASVQAHEPLNGSRTNEPSLTR